MSGPRLVRFSLGGRRFAALVDDTETARLPAGLTRAECEVALLLRRGSSNRAIARERGTSERTVANQISSLMRKLDAGSRVQLVLRLGPRRTPGPRPTK